MMTTVKYVNPHDRFYKIFFIVQKVLVQYWLVVVPS